MYWEEYIRCGRIGSTKRNVEWNPRAKSVSQYSISLIVDLRFREHKSANFTIDLRDGWRLQNGWIFGKVPNGLWPPPLIFGKSCCGFFIRLYSLKNHTCGIFLKSPGYESIKNNDPCCQIQCLNFKFWAGVVLRIWLKQGKEKRLLARILKFLEKARKRLSRQNSTKKCVNVRGKSPLCENREHC